MAGLSANVTLGPGVVPIPGQINVPAGPDEVSFSDAFAEAQATRLDAVDASDLATRQPEAAAVNRTAQFGAEPTLPEAIARRAAPPTWPSSARPASPSTRDDLAGPRATTVSVQVGGASSSGRTATRSGSTLPPSGRR